MATISSTHHNPKHHNAIRQLPTRPYWHSDREYWHTGSEPSCQQSDQDLAQCHHTQETANTTRMKDKILNLFCPKTFTKVEHTARNGPPGRDSLPGKAK